MNSDTKADSASEGGDECLISESLTAKMSMEMPN